MHLSANQIEILKQGAGKIGRPDYGDPARLQRDIDTLVREGLMERAYDDDQPTAYATPRGEAALTEALSPHPAMQGGAE